MKKRLYFAILAVVALLFACNRENELVDTDGNVYETVRVGTQTWMSQDLRVTHSPDGSALREFRPGLEEPSYLAYGGKTLYNAMAAQYGAGSGDGLVRGLCPKGWHLPSRDEWQVLSDYVTAHPELWGTSGTVSRALASQQWPSAENPTALNQTGFSAMPTGYLISYPRHTEIPDHEENINSRWVERESTYYWSATHNEHYPLTPPAPNDSIVIPGTPGWGGWLGNDSFQVHSYIFLLNINQENPRISSLPDVHYCAIRCVKDWAKLGLAALASDNDNLDNLDNLNSQNSPTDSPTVNVRNVPAGVYLLRVRDAEGKEYMRKIVKKWEPNRAKEYNS